MKQLVATVVRKLPRELKNYHLIKRQNIFIPYCEIGISCLTKEVTEINLFFETILKLIDIDVSDVHEISSIMGIEFKLLKETIVDMIGQRYVITVENKLIMTPKGRKALADRRLVTVRKRNLNEISVNMITGDIEESGKKIFVKPCKGDICLSEEQTITKDFLESNYANINEIYQRNQIEANIFNTRVLQRELYKILDITYDKLYYIKDELLIYKNNDSEDYEFIIKGDIGGRYQNSFYSQVRDVVYSGMENFFERDWKFSQKHYNEGIVSHEEKQYTRKLIEKLNGNEIVSDELLEEYTHARALIDESELETVFLYNKEFAYEGIIISCERLRKLLTSEIVSALNQITKKRTWLLYNPEEYNIKKFIGEKVGDKVKKKDISLLENKGLSNQFVCFYPNILIEFVEKTEMVFDRPITVFEGRIEFNSEIIKNKIDKIIDEYKISFLLFEPKSQMIEQNKYNKEAKKPSFQSHKKHRNKK